MAAKQPLKIKIKDIEWYLEIGVNDDKTMYTLAVNGQDQREMANYEQELLEIYRSRIYNEWDGPVK